MSEDEKQQKYFGFKDGLPTGPDVTAIQKEFTRLVPGDRIEYELIETIINCKPGTQRWRSITDAWRKRELENGIVIECEVGAAFYVMTAEQILEGRTYDVLKHIGNKARKNRRCLGTIRTDDERTKNIRDHQMRVMWSVEKDSKQNRKNLLTPPATATMARIGPPKSKAE